MDIITGVGNGSYIQHWDYEFIDLQYEGAKKEAFIDKYIELVNAGMDENDAEDEAKNFVDCEWECPIMDSTDQLYGDWLKDEEGKYYPNPNGEYAMIYDGNINIYQVVYSKYAIKSYHCSPCYPGQGDIDTPGELLAYCLPPDIMDDKWLEENKDRIIKECI